jgi:hypothetical protein
LGRYPSIEETLTAHIMRNSSMMLVISCKSSRLSGYPPTIVLGTYVSEREGEHEQSHGLHVELKRG